MYDIWLEVIWSIYLHNKCDRWYAMVRHDMGYDTWNLTYLTQYMMHDAWLAIHCVQTVHDTSCLIRIVHIWCHIKSYVLHVNPSSLIPWVQGIRRWIHILPCQCLADGGVIVLMEEIQLTTWDWGFIHVNSTNFRGDLNSILFETTSVDCVPQKQLKPDLQGFTSFVLRCLWRYCWWKNTCTSWYGEFPIFTRDSYCCISTG